MAWLQRIIAFSVPKNAVEKCHLKSLNMSPLTFVWRWKSDMTDFKHLAVKSVGEKSNVGLIRLNDRRTMNTLTSALLAELNQALRQFEGNESIACMILTGGERAFSVGADIREMSLMEFQDVFKSNFPSALCEVSNCRKPVIAAVSGHVFGGGCELAMMCDVIYASENAVFAQPEISLATIPGAGGTQRLLRAVGKSKAMEMVLSGMKMSAKEACLAGLVSKVFPSDEVVDASIRFAEKVAGFSPMIVQMAKQAVNTCAIPAASVRQLRCWNGCLCSTCYAICLFIEEIRIKESNPFLFVCFFCYSLMLIMFVFVCFKAFETSLTSGLQYEKILFSQIFACKVARNG